MTGQVVLRRRHPVLLSKQSVIASSTSSGCSRFAEVAGGTAAECAVICCCCPCGILHLAILALTLPAGICRRMLRKRQRQQQRLLKKGLVPRRRSCSCGYGEGRGAQADRQVFPIGMATAAMVSLDDDVVENLDEEKEVMRLEKEMWDIFYSTGFWRSPSQRHN